MPSHSSPKRSNSLPPSSFLNSKTAVVAGIVAAGALAYKLSSNSEADHGGETKSDLRAAKDAVKEHLKDRCQGENREFRGPARPREHMEDTYNGLKGYFKDVVLGEGREYGKAERGKQRWEMMQEQEDASEEDDYEHDNDRETYYDDDDDGYSDYDRTGARPGGEFVEGESRRRRQDEETERPLYDYEDSRGRRQRPSTRGDLLPPSPPSSSRVSPRVRNNDYFDRASGSKTSRHHPSQRSRSVLSPPSEWPGDVPVGGEDRESTRRRRGKRGARRKSRPEPEDVTSQDRIAAAMAERGMPPPRETTVLEESQRGTADEALDVGEEVYDRRGHGRGHGHGHEEERDGKRSRDGGKGHRKSKSRHQVSSKEPFVQEKTYVWDGERARPEEIVYRIDRGPKA